MVGKSHPPRSFEIFAAAMEDRAMVTTVSANALLYKEKEKKAEKWAEDFGSYTTQLLSEAPTRRVSKDGSKEGSRGSGQNS